MTFYWERFLSGSINNTIYTIYLPDKLSEWLYEKCNAKFGSLGFAQSLDKDKCWSNSSSQQKYKNKIVFFHASSIRYHSVTSECINSHLTDTDVLHSVKF